MLVIRDPELVGGVNRVAKVGYGKEEISQPRISAIDKATP
jgi:hypothetical protein